MVSSLIFTLLCIIFSGGTLLGQIAYRSIFISTTVVYSLSLLQRFQGEKPSTYVLLRMDSFQYGAIGFFWLFTKWHFIKIVPFAFFSSLHVSSFALQHLQPGSSLYSRVEKFQNVDGPKMMRIVVYSDLLVFLRLFLDLITFQNGTFFSILAFSFYYRIRLAYSPITQNVSEEVFARIDNFIASPKVPAKVKEIWANVKDAAGTHDSPTLDPTIARERAKQIRKMNQQDAQEAKMAREKFQKAQQF